MSEIAINFGLSLVHLFVGLISSVLSVFFGLRLLDKMTGYIDEWKELKKGNIAVGLLFVSVILSVLIMIAPTALLSMSLIDKFNPASAFFINVFIAFANIFLATFFAIFSLYISFQVADRLTLDIDELAELKKGNTAVALMISAILLGIAIVVTRFITEMVSSLNLVGFAQ